MKVLFLPILLVLISSPTPPIDSIIADDMEYLTAFYKERHQHPEISLEEEETAAALGAELKKIGFEVTQSIGGHGVVGIYKNGNGPQILYRSDMDALPMQEKTGLEYASTTSEENEAMHSCGHDMHMTAMVGTARAMVKMKDQWNGTLMMIGQPAEEIGAGSNLMLKAGLYDKFGVPDYGIGLHCSATIPAGQLGVREGFSMANTESCDIYIKGRGAHGASPHMSIDPVVLGSMMVMDLQTIVSRNLKPAQSAVITVGAFKSGTKHNIISDEAHLQLTIRTYEEDVREMVHRRIKEIANGVAMAAGLTEDMMPEVVFKEGATPANYNDPKLTAQIINSGGKAIGKNNVIDQEPLMLGEDFSRYGSTEHKVPTVLYWLGTMPEDRAGDEVIPGLHSPYYYPEIETSLKTAIKVNTGIMLDLMGG